MLALQMQRHTFLLREAFCHTLLSNLFSVIACSQAVNVLLGCLMIFNQLDASADGDIIVAILDTNGDTRVEAHIAIFEASSFCIHDNRVALQKVPHGCLLRSTVSIKGG